jgi:ABC-type multidrug transport system ATPase subunit
MLDPRGRQEVIRIMERLNREDGITVINITHYMEEAARADRVIVINDGKMIIDDTPEAVFSKVEYFHEITMVSLSSPSRTVPSRLAPLW